MNPFRMAAEAIAFFGPAVCERIALHQVKALAFRASADNAGQIVLWATVLARSRSIRLAVGEAEHLIATAEHAEELAALERQSRPQVIRLHEDPQDEPGG